MICVGGKVFYSLFTCLNVQNGCKKCFDNYESVEVHSLPFAIWKMRKYGDGTQSESEALRVEDGCLSSSRKNEWALPPSFCCTQSFCGLDGTAYSGKGGSLYSMC